MKYPVSQFLKEHECDMYDNIIAMNLYTARVQKNISRDDLARTVHISSEELQNYEQATVPLPADLLVRFSIALSLPIEYFFKGIDDEDEVQEERWLGAA